MADVLNNARNLKMNDGMGMDVKKTDQLGGLSHTTAAQKETNETVNYTTPKFEKGDLGGKNTNS